MGFVRAASTLVLLAVALAGCAETPPPAADDVAATAATEASATTRTEEHVFHGNYSLGLLEVTPDGELPRHDLQVEEGAVGLRVELSWTGTGDLDLVVESPFACYDPRVDECANLEAATRTTGDGRFHDADGHPAAPDSPSVLELDADDIATHTECRRLSGCGWFAIAHPTAGAQVAWTLRATVTYEVAS